MSYTVSHRQMGLTKADVAGLARHNFRDVDKSLGIEISHSNEMIDPNRTDFNRSFIFRDGKPEKMGSVDELLDELDNRLSKAGGTRVDPKTGETKKIAVRKDAKVVREVVLQLDPDFTGSSVDLLNDLDHRNLHTRLMNVMIKHYADLYGKDNLLGLSIHMDETNPHAHLWITPIDNQGRIRQASFIKPGRGPKSAMSQNDRALRQRLKAKDYDVDLEPRGGRKHLSINDYKTAMKAHQIDINEREVNVFDREINLDQREDDLKWREEGLNQREERLERAEGDLRRLQDETEQKYAEALKTRQKASESLSEVSELEEQMRKMLSELEDGTRTVAPDKVISRREAEAVRQKALRLMYRHEERHQQPEDNGLEIG